jgi:hypothetical protein
VNQARDAAIHLVALSRTIPATTKASDPLSELLAHILETHQLGW